MSAPYLCGPDNRSWRVAVSRRLNRPDGSFGGAVAALVEVGSIERLYRIVRPQAKYRRSLELLRRAKEMVPDMVTKSGMMLGVGEDLDETREAMRHLEEGRCLGRIVVTP